MPTVLVAGRFQPLHLGHEAVLAAASEIAGAAGRVIVAVGSSQESGTWRNPFDFEERRSMLKAACGPGVEVVAVPDLHDPPNWVAHLQGLVGPFDVVVGNDGDTMALFEAAGVPLQRTGLSQRDVWQASRIRGLMANGDSAWKKSVSAPVVAVLENLQGPQRLQALLP